MSVSTPTQSLGRNYTGRLAPSPTGALHLGNIRTFMIAWLRARQLGGRVILRIEDLDHPRDKPGVAAALVEDLRWLGFDWDAQVVQSTRRTSYHAALDKLKEQGLVYPCICSRKDVEGAQSAPHEGEQLFYSGTCRGLFATWDEAAAKIAPRLPCWRFNLEAWLKVHPEDREISVPERFSPKSEPCCLVGTLGDFPLARDVDGAGYTLAAVVDDAEEGVTEVVRGDDLFAATPAQMIIQHALGLPTPHYLHVPLVVGTDGKRLAKRHGDTRIAYYREKGATAEQILGFLAHSCGWAVSSHGVTLKELLNYFDLGTIPHSPYVMEEAEHV